MDNNTKVMASDILASDGLSPCGSSQQAVSPVPTSIPDAIADQVLSMGKVEWGATDRYTDAGHLEHLAESLRLTRERFNFGDGPVAMYGLYLEGTETVLCHTGTSPNSGANAQALTGAWNWLYEQCLAQAMAARSGETGTGSTEGNSAVPIGDAPIPPSASHSQGCE